MLSTKSTSYQNLHEEEKSKNHFESIKLLLKKKLSEEKVNMQS